MNDTTTKEATTPPAQKKRVSKQEDAQPFIVLLPLLALTCLNLLANNMLNNAIRAFAAYWSPFLNLPLDQSSEMGNLTRYLNFFSIAMGPFGGYLTDYLSSPVALVIFATISGLGSLFFALTTFTVAPKSFYFIS